jgi:cobalamin biosynthesis protein CbiD
MGFAFLEILKSVVGSIIGSRIGQLAIVAAVAWFWSAHDASIRYDKLRAAEKAAAESVYLKELIRQQQAAEEIAKAATQRAEDDSKVVSNLQEIIADYENKLKEKSNVVKVDECVVDDNFINVVQQLSTAASRSTKAPRRSPRVR